jgi:hypothetical protein
VVGDDGEDGRTIEVMAAIVEVGVNCLCFKSVRAMEERIHFIKHQQKQILLVDFSRPREAEKIARALPDHVTAQPRGSLLMLVDFGGASFDVETLRAMKEAAVFNKPHIKKSAWIGSGNMPKDTLQDIKTFSRREIPAFESREEALAWLVKE